MSKQSDGAETTSETSGVASHDAPVPDGFAEYMSTGWAPADLVLPDASDVAPYASKRREVLARSFPGDTLIVPTGTFKVRANDTDYKFRPGSDFYWLTGCTESDAVLVLLHTEEGTVASTLYLPDRSDRSTSAFYRDRRYGELWVGPRNGVRETEAMLGIECRSVHELPAMLETLESSSVRVVPGIDPVIDDRFPISDRSKELAQRISDLRLIKDDYETARLREAMHATAVGFEECVRELQKAATFATGERWLEGTFWRRARLDGNDVGYGSIVACGHHATTLHWEQNDGPVRPGDLALLDMGVESRSLYTADITRTLPINGTFSPTQRMVYDAVHDAQQTALLAVRPGAAFLDPHRAAMKVLARYLEEWGVLPGTAEESLAENAGFHRRFTLHGVSHMLGLDVHDCANARADLYYDGTLQPGMVLTVEPGLYFQRDDLTVPEEFRGIGVRIEDDVLVTNDGHEVLSSHLPTAAADVEQWMASLR